MYVWFMLFTVVCVDVSLVFSQSEGKANVVASCV